MRLYIGQSGDLDSTDVTDALLMTDSLTDRL